MTYDNTLKYLVEQYPEQFARWLLASEAIDIQILKTELSIELIRADAVIFLQIGSRILHLEFQTLPESKPPIPLRMLDYWVRLYRQYECDIEQVVIFLKQTTAEAAFIDRFSAPNTWHRYRVIRLWEQDPELLLASPALLPLATLARTDSPRRLLERVAERVDTIEERNQRQSISACTQLIAGLLFDVELIRQLFRRDMLRESVVYQEILREGIEQGELTVIRRQLTRRRGEIEPELQIRIERLSIARLGELSEVLLDVSEVADLIDWLDRVEDGEVAQGNGENGGADEVLEN